MRRDVFNAIADPTRRSILMTLIEDKQNVNSLAEKFDISRQAVSLHVKYLHECGVISIHKEGRERICELEGEKLAELEDWLTPFRKLCEKRFDQLDSLFNDLKKNQ
ncbi:MAG: metalloregulator ArsR/SmtB family transcription factor [bacterium]|nr:metalloregulator ArsR/SmtB family transcription factor [bacterium]